MAIADSFIVRSYLIVLVNQFDLNNFLKRLGMLVVISRFQVGRKLEVSFFLLTFIPMFANKLSGDLLDINFQAIYNSNKRLTTENTNVFGISWIGNGATIKRMPLLNMLAMCGSKPPAVIAILDCTGHMVDGGK